MFTLRAPRLSYSVKTQIRNADSKGAHDPERGKELFLQSAFITVHRRPFEFFTVIDPKMG